MIAGGREALGVKNIETVLGTESDPRLDPASVDLILLVDAYHEFSYPREMGLAMANALKPGGRLVLIEYRGEDPNVPIKRLHKMNSFNILQIFINSLSYNRIFMNRKQETQIFIPTT